MKKNGFAGLCSAAAAAAVLAGCGGSPAASSSAPPAVQMERVPVVDEQYKDIFSDYDIVGTFHDGVAFAAKCLFPEDPEKAFEEMVLEVECGYLTLDGEFTPLYTVPSEYDLITPEGRRSEARASQDLFLYSNQAQAMLVGYDAQMLDVEELWTVPYTKEQEIIDETFAVGDNGWVPYYEDGKWGYCDLEGNITLAPAYDFAQSFCDGSALVCSYDGQFHWSLIDETGAVKASFEPGEYFATRQPGSSFVLLSDKMATGTLYRTDGTPVDEQRSGQHGGYLDSGTGLLTASFFPARVVYDAEGNFLYENENIELVGVENGCTVFWDGTYYGILGSDGQVRCEAKFMDILKLTPEGFYAREQGKAGLGLYDYDGNLLQDAPICAWIDESNNECTVYDGAGNVLAEYLADSGQPGREGERLFTDDGFLYLRLSDSEFVTLHITFEERPVQPQAEPTAAPAGSGELTVTQTTSQQMQWCFESLDRWSFVVKDFDSLSPLERQSVYTKEGLEWYYTPQDELVVCDDAMNTLLTIPQEGVQLTQRTYPSGIPNHSNTEMRYMGDGLWYIYLKGLDKQDIYDHALYVFNREGNIVFSRLQPDERSSNFDVPDIVSEGYFFVGDTCISAQGEVLPVKAEGEPVLETWYGSYFSGGLAPTGWGYIDTSGNVVLSAETLNRALEAWGAEGQTVAVLQPFQDGTALILAENAGGDGFCYRIDDTGKILEQREETDIELYGEELQTRFEELQEKYKRDLSRGAFRIVSRKEQNTVIVPSGAEVFAPEGWEMGDSCIQWTDDFAFIMMSSEEPGKGGYMLIDAQGRFYPEYCWRDVLPTQGSSANVYDYFEEGDNNIFTMTHIEIGTKAG